MNAHREAGDLAQVNEILESILSPEERHFSRLQLIKRVKAIQVVECRSRDLGPASLFSNET